MWIKKHVHYRPGHRASVVLESQDGGFSAPLTEREADKALETNPVLVERISHHHADVNDATGEDIGHEPDYFDGANHYARDRDEPALDAQHSSYERDSNDDAEVYA